MCFRPRKCLLGVRTMGDVIWGKYPPKTPQKEAWIGSFKPKRQNLYITISLELLIRQTSDLRSEFIPQKALRGWSAITPKHIQHGWRTPSWKSIWRHIAVAGVPIWTKFGSRMQNDTAITAKWSRSKPEVGFQYGGRLYFETGSSYLSRQQRYLEEIWFADRLWVVKAAILRNGHDVIFPQWVPWFGRKSVAWYKITCRLWRTGRDRHRM